MADVTLPQLGETVTEGTITRWFKKVGDTVAADEPLFEVSTDKVDTEVPSPITGTVTEIRVQEGDTVPVGAVIAVVGEAAGAPRLLPRRRRNPSLRPPSQNLPRRPRNLQHRNLLHARTSRCAGTCRCARTCRCRADRRSPCCTGRAAGRRRGRPGTAAGCRADSPSDNRLLSPVVRRLVAEHNINVDLTSRAPAPVVGSPATTCSTTSIAPPPLPRPRLLPPPRLQRPSSSRACRCGGPAIGTRCSPGRSPGSGRRPGRARHAPCRLTKIRKLTGSHMVMSKGVSPHAFSVVEVDFANVDVTRNKVKTEWKADRGLRPHLPAVHHPRRRRGARRVPAPQRQRLRRRPRRAQLHRHRHRRRSRLPRVAGAGGARRRDQAAAGDRPRDQRPCRARPQSQAEPRRDQRRHVHHLQQRLGRQRVDDADHQPAAGGDPVDRCDRAQAGRRARRRWRRGHRDPPGRQPGDGWDHRAFDGAYAAGFLVKIKETLETRDWSAEL